MLLPPGAPRDAAHALRGMGHKGALDADLQHVRLQARGSPIDASRPFLE